MIVAGGRGIGSAEGFAVLEELAKVLGGAVGATRAACDNGWRPVSEQIGLTGKIVGPTLYFAVGISGASQHMAGCSGAKNIVADQQGPGGDRLQVVALRHRRRLQEGAAGARRGLQEAEGIGRPAIARDGRLFL